MLPARACTPLLGRIVRLRYSAEVYLFLFQGGKLPFRMEHESRMDTKDAGKEQQRQDPLLNPGQLKQIVKNLPGKLKVRMLYNLVCNKSADLGPFLSYRMMTTSTATPIVLIKNWMSCLTMSKLQRMSANINIIVDANLDVCIRHATCWTAQLICISD